MTVLCKVWSIGLRTLDDGWWGQAVAGSAEKARDYLRILVYLVIYDSGQVSLEHLLLSWYPSLNPTPGAGGGWQR